MTLIDTHTHLYLAEFAQDIEQVIADAQALGVAKMYLPAISSEETSSLLALEAKFPGVCIAMMGLHPCYVKENFQKELDWVAEWLSKRSFVAIGEIGLDFYWDTQFANEQLLVFNQQMEWALEKNLPIVIHSRKAMNETLAAVKPFAKKGLRGIFHCFSGSQEEALAITKMGFYLGIGGVLTYKNSKLAENLSNVSVDWMVLETDAPYLSPVPFRGKRNQPAYLKQVLEQLAIAKNQSPDEIAAITTANAQKIFGY